MRKTIRGSILSSLFWISVVFFVVVSVAPLVLYQHTLGLVDGLPTKPAALLGENEAEELWKSEEKCQPAECASITPYWVYRWLLVAVINDYVRPIPLEIPYQNVSKMASRVAITHMRNGHFRGKGMLWWHLTHAYLSIWVQRNWTPNEIASKYKQIGA